MTDELSELIGLMKKITELLGKLGRETEKEREKLYNEMDDAAGKHLSGKKLLARSDIERFRGDYAELAKEAGVEVEEIFGKKVVTLWKKDEGNIPSPSKEDWKKIECGIPPEIGRFNSRRENARHGALDIYAEIGTPLYAPHAGRGVVLFAGEFGEKEGNAIIVIGKDDRGDVAVTSYSHCEKILAEQGGIVQGYEAGKTPEKIALLGNTGTAQGSGPHVHFVVAREMQIVENGNKKTLNAEETRKFFGKILAMKEGERKNYLRKIQVVALRRREDPETYIKNGVVGSPVLGFGKISLEYCNYFKKKKPTTAAVF